MPPSSSHSLALFSLVPHNKAAEAVVADPANAAFASQGQSGLVLDIGHTRPKPCGTLVTLGRGDVDIYVGHGSISRVQCSFAIDPVTHVVMLHDLSRQRSTQILDENGIPFEHERERQIVVHKRLNTLVGMGGEKQNLVQFQLQWHKDLVGTMEQVKARQEAQESIRYQENARLARTVAEADTVAQTPRYDTRIHVPSQLRIRYIHLKGGQLGKGQFAVVSKVLNVDTGKFMALKTLRKPAVSNKRTLAKLEKSAQYALKREIETLSRTHHPFIVEYVGSQGWGGPGVEIFMALKEGSLESLVDNILEGDPTERQDRLFAVTTKVFSEMLSALDFLAYNQIVHRDVKPANILYTANPDGQYVFQLGDFGLCNRTCDAETTAGSPAYMAPELHDGTGSQEKADVWSLFVTLLWVLDVSGFREKADNFKTYQDIKTTVIDAADNAAIVKPIRQMAVVESGLRASAAQMLANSSLPLLAHLLTTPLSQIPPLIPYPQQVSISTPPLAAPVPVPSRLPASPVPGAAPCLTATQTIRGPHTLQRP